MFEGAAKAIKEKFTNDAAVALIGGTREEQEKWAAFNLGSTVTALAVRPEKGGTTVGDQVLTYFHQVRGQTLCGAVIFDPSLITSDTLRVLHNSLSTAANLIPCTVDELIHLVYAEGPATETPTDDEIIAACHSVGVDTTPSVYGFDALQMRASIPVLRNVINALRKAGVRLNKLSVEDVCKLVCQHTGKRINLRVDEVEQHIDFADAVVALAREDLAECQSNEFSSRMCEAGTKGCAILHSVALTDGCTFCLGAKGGVPGNANVIGGQVVCDYCTSLLMTVKDNEKAKPSGSLFAPIREQEPDWSGSKTLESELWKNPLLSMAERLQMADGAVRFRNDVIANLRAQLAEAKAAPTREAPVELPEKPERDGNWAGDDWYTNHTLNVYATEAVLKDRAGQKGQQ